LVNYCLFCSYVNILKWDVWLKTFKVCTNFDKFDLRHCVPQNWSIYWHKHQLYVQLKKLVLNMLNLIITQTEYLVFLIVLNLKKFFLFMLLNTSQIGQLYFQNNLWAFCLPDLFNSIIKKFAMLGTKLFDKNKPIKSKFTI